jgi:transketolase
MFASHSNLNNLIAIVDCNHIQKMGFTKDIMSIDNWKDKFKAFGWNVKEVDGHNVNKLDKVFDEGNESDKPLVILANTVKGKGVSIIENDPRWHWRLPNKKELKVFMQELNITEEEINKCRKAI